MKSPFEIVEEQMRLNAERTMRVERESEKTNEKLWILKFASDTLKSIKSHTYKSEVVNIKDYTKQLSDVEAAIRGLKLDEVTVKNKTDYTKKLDSLIKAVESIKIPEVKIPETKIPDNSKELKSLETAVKNIKFPELKVEQKNIDLSVLVTELKSLKNSIKLPDSPDYKKIENIASSVPTQLKKDLSETLLSVENSVKQINIPETDLSAVIDATQKTTKAIQDLKFPVATFNSQGIIDAVNSTYAFAPDANIETTISGNVITQTDGTKTYTFTQISPTNFTEEWS